MALVLSAPYPDGGGAMRRGTFKDLPTDLGFGLWDTTQASSITLDGSNLISSIENVFGNGSNPAVTTDATKRRSLSTYNGLVTSYSAGTSLGPHIISNTTGVPLGNADRHYTWIALSMDGVVCGYNGGRAYWVDNPFPDYRIRTNNGDFTGTGSTDQNSLHSGSLNHTSGVTTLTVDGAARGSFTVTLDTSLGSLGFAGANSGFFPMKGHFVLFFMGKRAATADEQAKIDSAAQAYHGKALPSGHPYVTTPWMVPA